jgi:hypothetical protein
VKSWRVKFEDTCAPVSGSTLSIHSVKRHDAVVVAVRKAAC